MTRVLLKLFVAAMMSVVAMCAQVADALIASGREALAAGNITNAYGSFNAAVNLSPANSTALALRGWSGLLALPYQSQAAGFLDRLGISPEGRNPLAWHANIPADAGGGPLAPTNMTAADGIAALRNIVLPRLLETESDFAAITNPAFVLNLSAQETGVSQVSVDLGDVLLLRSFLHFFRYFGYTLNEWNFDIELQDLRDSLAGEGTGASRFLETHINLLSLASTNDAALARASFLGFYTNYIAASTFIRSRSTSDSSRLFTLDSGELRNESRFRTNLIALRATLDRPGTLHTREDLVFDLSRHFSAPVAPRQLLPQITDGGFVAGTLPDTTFRGFVTGIEEASVERFILTSDILGSPRNFRVLPRLGALRGRQLDAAVFAGRSYRIEISSDMGRWSPYDSFVAGSNRVTIELPLSSEAVQFYRLAELSRPANDLFESRVRLSGQEVGTFVDLSGAYPNLPFEPSFPASSVWFEWTAPRNGLVEITMDEYPYEVFSGTNVASLSPAAAAGPDIWPVTAGGRLLIAVGSWPWQAGGPNMLARLNIRMLEENVNETWAEATPLQPDSLSISGQNFGAIDDPAPDGSGPLPRALWWRWQPSVTGRYVWNNETWNSTGFGTGRGDHLLIFRVRDGRPDVYLADGDREVSADVIGGQSYAVVVFAGPAQFHWTAQFAPLLPNDTAARAARLAGPGGSVAGGNLGAELDDFERGLFPAFSDLRSMVWYRWTPPGDGVVEWSFDSSETDPVLGVFLGATPGNWTRAGVNPDIRLVADASTATDQWIAVMMDRFSGRSGPYTLNWRLSARETNDLFSARAPLSGNLVSLQGRDVSATIEPGEPTPFLGPQWRSVWWTWTAGADGLLSVRVRASNAGSLQASVYTGSSVSALATVPVRSSNFLPDGTREIVVQVSSGVPYQIQLCSDSPLERFDLVLEYGASVVPSNNAFAARPALAGGTVVVTGTNRNADMEQGEPVPAGSTAWQASIWWSWTAPASALTTVTTDGSNFDTLLGIYTGSALSSLINLGRDDDSGDGVASLLRFSAIQGQTYAIQVAGFNGSVGDVRLEIRQAP